MRIVETFPVQSKGNLVVYYYNFCLSIPKGNVCKVSVWPGHLQNVKHCLRRYKYSSKVVRYVIIACHGISNKYQIAGTSTG